MARDRWTALWGLMAAHLQPRGYGSGPDVPPAAEPQETFSRREFLRRSGAVGGALGLGGAVAAAPVPGWGAQQGQVAASFNTLEKGGISELGPPQIAGLRLLLRNPWNTSRTIRGGFGGPCPRVGPSPDYPTISSFALSSNAASSTDRTLRPSVNALVTGLETVFPGIGSLGRKGTATISAVSAARGLKDALSARREWR